MRRERARACLFISLAPMLRLSASMSFIAASLTALSLCSSEVSASEMGSPAGMALTPNALTA